jgi:hypothetical protein
VGCGAWWETAKGTVAAKGTFRCDCGAWLEIDVPAIDGIRGLSNEERLELLAGVLDTGMKAKEAIERASVWWDRIGRLAINDRPNLKKFACSDPDDPRFLASGILNGHTWDMLGKREQIQVVKVWHHFHVRKPDLIGGADDEHKMQDRGTIN